ncbi:MAG TPA: MBL fold metallo-hydrolase [Gemmatimonadaceae bacterium]|nr:MBL fold metallo-hydrolase [Gemmatimonadaceae bacterium]
MILRRLYDDELAQAGYLLGCEATHEAVVVDPNLDIQRYIDAAQDEGLAITHVTETHIHADFVSGVRALAAATGARLLVSAEGGPDWQYRVPDGATLVHDNDEIHVGAIHLTALHTPGHTPEHLSFLVTDTAVSDQPVGMLSGDFIFVGDVGRPDLLERAAHVAGTMDTSARQLFASLRRTASLPDHLQLWPGHGAGSACGKALGAMPQSTLGYERLVNAALRQTDETAFVREILAAQPEPPRYFARMKRVNRDGAPAAPTGDLTRRLDAGEVDAAIRGGVLVIDTRPSAAFCTGFVPGAICVPKSKSFSGYFGTVAPEEAPVVVLVDNASDVSPLVQRLRLIGFDRVAGWAVAAEVLAARRRSGSPVATLDRADLAEVRRRLAGRRPPRLVDVRGAGEREAGVIPGSIGVALGDLADWAAAASREDPVIVQCHAGSRAVIGASVLVGRGFANVTPMTGGYDAWTAAGLPVLTPAPS